MFHSMKAYEIVDYRRDLEPGQRLDGVGSYAILPGGTILVQNHEGIQAQFDMEDALVDEGDYLEVHTPDSKVALIELTLASIPEFNEVEATPEFASVEEMHEYFMDLLRRVEHG